MKDDNKRQQQDLTLLKGGMSEEPDREAQEPNQTEQETVFTQDNAEEALEKLRKYKSGKTSIDMKATENQEWWRLRHWNYIKGQKEEQGRMVGSGHTFDMIDNKHADIMDSFPKPNVLAREADDEEEAKALSKILPVILEENNYEEVYSNAGLDMLVDGGAITAVVWDNTKYDGLGDISLKNIDVHNLFWEPGVEDIQDSEFLFHVTLEDVDYMKQAWPEFAEQIGAYDPADVVKYIHDDNIDFSNKVEVVDCYYKRVVMEQANDEAGNLMLNIPKKVLHMAKMVGGVLVFCSENDTENYPDGYYWHGEYPFVVRRRYKVKDTPWGFGDLDVAKHVQADVDKLDQAITKNAIMKSKPRYWVKQSAAIDVKKFADWDEDIIPVASGDLNANVLQVNVDAISEMTENHLQYKIDELKETTGNRDFSQGATSSGVTAASAIAALQEAGSKKARNMNKTMYRGSRQEYYLCVELIRQFYTEERSFRIADENGGYQYALYSNEGIQAREAEYMGGIKRRKPVFDIEISAEKQSPFSRAAQNETAKELYQLGLFNPEQAQSALVCINMMEFEGKDSIKQQIQQNAVFLQQMQQWQQLLLQADQFLPGIAAQAGIVDAQQEAQLQQQNAQQMARLSNQGTAEERAARHDTDTTAVAKARQKAAKQAEVK